MTAADALLTKKTVGWRHQECGHSGGEAQDDQRGDELRSIHSSCSPFMVWECSFPSVLTAYHI